MSQMKISKEATNYVVLAVIVVVLILVYKIYGGFEEAANAVKDMFGAGSGAKDVDSKISKRDGTPKSKDPFSPEYIKSRMKTAKPNTLHLLKGATKQSLIKKIQSDTSWLNWFESGQKIISLFKTITHKTQISDLALEYQNKTGKDMLTDIKERMQRNLGGWLSNADVNKHISELINYVNNLPE